MISSLSIAAGVTNKDLTRKIRTRSLEMQLDTFVLLMLVN